jgi:hypothetical protein
VITLGFDQIPLDEDSRTFDSLSRVVEYAKTQLNGSYSESMTEAELEQELEQNGYYILS